MARFGLSLEKYNKRKFSLIMKFMSLGRLKPINNIEGIFFDGPGKSAHGTPARPDCDALNVYAVASFVALRAAICQSQIIVIYLRPTTLFYRKAPAIWIETLECSVDEMDFRDETSAICKVIGNREEWEIDFWPLCVSWNDCLRFSWPI